MNWIKLSCIIIGLAMANNGFAQNVEYQMSFQGQWTSSIPRPGGAHFSPLVGSTHNLDGAFFTAGTLASTGVENVAEIGSASAMIGEINAQISAGNAGALITRSGDVGPTQTVTVNFTTTADHPFFSLITMIAPSPDWIVGAGNVNLQDANGNWKQQISIDLNSYDAGTEEGSNFSLSNPPTNPQEPIQLLDDAEPSGVLFGHGSIGRIVLTRLTPITTTIEPESFSVTRGQLVAGSEQELAASDNVDLSAVRSATDIQSRVFVEVEAVAPSTNPTEIEFVLEGAVFARSTVNQTIELWDFSTKAWVTIDTRAASRFSDSTATVQATGDISRFVDDYMVGRIRARVRYQSVNPRQQFSANVDQMIWNITD